MVRSVRFGSYALAATLLLSNHALGFDLSAAVPLDGPPGAASARDDVPYPDGRQGLDFGSDQRGGAGQWIGGAEMTFLRVDASTGGRITLAFDDSRTGGTDFAAIGGRGVEDFGTAPRLWLGRRINDEWGIVGRYWRLDEHDTNFPEPMAYSAQLPNFATFEDSAEVEMQTGDLEGVRSFQFGKWKFDGSIGGRYGSYDAEARMMAFGVFTTGNFVNMRLETGSSFTGGGITSGLVGRRQIADLPLFLFAGGRGSVMGGTTESFSRAAGVVVSNPSTPLSGAATIAEQDNDSTMTIAEFQVGMEYDFKLAYLPGSAFVRTAFEYQHWNVSGPPVQDTGFGGTIGDLTTNSGAYPDHGDAILYGVAVSAGYTW